MLQMFGVLFAAYTSLISALPPEVPYEPFLKIGEQKGFDVIDPSSNAIHQLSSGPDLVLRPVSSKAKVIAKIMSTWFNAQGTQIIKIEADYWLAIDTEPVFLSMPGGIQVNDTRNGGTGMCVTLGLLRPVKIFPAQPAKVTFNVFLERVPRDDDPTTRLSGRKIVPWFELASDYERRTNVPSAAFEWDHVLRLSNHLHITKAKFREVDTAYIKEVVDEAFGDCAAATRATITRQWKECLEDLHRTPRPTYVWTRPAQIEWEKEKKQSRQTEMLVSAAGVISGSVLIQKSFKANAVKREPDVLDRGNGVATENGRAALEGGTEAAFETDECNEAGEEATGDKPATERKKRQTRRGRGTLRKQFESLPECEKPGSRADASDEQSLPDTTSDLFYPSFH